MVTYPFVHLPDYYVQLLRGGMQGIEFNANQFNAYVYDNRPFLALLENHFADIDPELRIDAILKSMTWKGVRNRMARLFLHYEMHGQFGLDESDLKELNEILFWEDRLSAYAADGHYRAFLLGFYFKMGAYQAERLLTGRERKGLVMKEEILELFKYCKSRTPRLDWPYLLMDHYLDFFGKKKLVALLEDRLSFADISALLSKEQEHELYSNLLSYGASIGESEIFTNETILL